MACMPKVGIANTLAVLANALVERIVTAAANGSEYNFGFVVPTVYDTAWVSMVSKIIDGQRQWLFPECFRYLLSMDPLEDNSGLNNSGVSEILGALAKLLALKKHHSSDIANSDLPSDMPQQIAKLTRSLETRLQDWDVESTDYIGFELLVPSLLEMLEKDGASFNFPGRGPLNAKRCRKLLKFNASHFYKPVTTTAIFHLDAFIGQLDFDRVAHHKTRGCFLGSPSSTAAYLMNASEWDPEAEEYLRHVVSHGYGKGTGGVPNVFATGIFETAWAVSALLGSGWSTNDLGYSNCRMIADYLESQVQAGNGVNSHGPSFLPDSDASAQTLLTLRRLGKPVDARPLIRRFEAEAHFQTYELETGVSISANASVLKLLLELETPASYKGQITKVASFLCDRWRNDMFVDKWHQSPLYISMLGMQAFDKLLSMDNCNGVPGISKALKHQIAVTMSQMTMRILQNQSSTGSWDSSVEITSYAILALIAGSSFPWTEKLEVQLDRAVRQGRKYLHHSTDQWTRPKCIWISKTNYGSPILCEGYCLAAVKAAKAPKPGSEKLRGLESPRGVKEVYGGNARKQDFSCPPGLLETSRRAHD